MLASADLSLEPREEHWAILLWAGEDQKGRGSRILVIHRSQVYHQWCVYTNIIALYIEELFYHELSIKFVIVMSLFAYDKTSCVSITFSESVPNNSLFWTWLQTLCVVNFGGTGCLWNRVRGHLGLRCSMVRSRKQNGCFTLQDLKWLNCTLLQSTDRATH